MDSRSVAIPPPGRGGPTDGPASLGFGHRASAVAFLVFFGLGLFLLANAAGVLPFMAGIALSLLLYSFREDCRTS